MLTPAVHLNLYGLLFSDPVLPEMTYLAAPCFAFTQSVVFTPETWLQQVEAKSRARGHLNIFPASSVN